MTSLLTLACSGPGAADAIARSSQIGLGCFAASLGLTVTLFFFARRAVRTRGLVAMRVGAVALLVLHPLWLFGTTSGDCGFTVRQAAPAVLLLHVGLTLVTWRSAGRAA